MKNGREVVKKVGDEVTEYTNNEVSRHPFRVMCQTLRTVLIRLIPMH